MTTTPYKPVSFTSESISQAKLQQMANNDQWLFENTPRLRYSASGLIRDAGIKMISGKTPYAKSTAVDYADVYVYFGSFFTAGCRPIIVANAEATGGAQRKLITLRGLGGEIDHRGFVAHLSMQELAQFGVMLIDAPGWIHWQAVGY